MYGTHIVDAVKNKELLSNNTLHVVSVCENPARFSSRYRLYRDFQARMAATPNILHYSVELAYGDRAFEVTSAANPRDLQLRCNQELFHKENLLNLGIKRLLPKDWKYLAWLDGDITFSNPNWAQNCMQQLQHFPIIQPWSECNDLGPHGNIMQTFTSLAKLHATGQPYQFNCNDPYKYGHSGFAWACTRYAWENMPGGLMDFTILGSADFHMSHATLGNAIKTMDPKKVPASFIKRVMDWQRGICKVTQGQHVGYTEGYITHSFHGAKRSRAYRSRWNILYDNRFDPDTDLSYDSQGVIQLTSAKPKLVADIRNYFRQRNEDGVNEY